jgi:hypothetical protein
LPPREDLAVAQGDAADFALPTSTLIFALGEVLAYENARGEIPFAHVCREAFRALAPGGSLVFDLLRPEVLPTAGWRDGKTWLVASRSEVEGDRLTRWIVAFSRSGSDWTRADETHRQRLHRPEAVEALLTSIGFEAARLCQIGGVTLLPGRIAFRGCKPDPSCDKWHE